MRNGEPCVYGVVADNCDDCENRFECGYATWIDGESYEQDPPDVQ